MRAIFNDLCLVSFKVFKMSFHEKLITCVFERTSIWDPRHKDHKNKIIVNKLWEEISKIAGSDGKHLFTYFFL